MFWVLVLVFESHQSHLSSSWLCPWGCKCCTLSVVSKEVFTQYEDSTPGLQCFVWSSLTCSPKLWSPRSGIHRLAQRHCHSHTDPLPLWTGKGPFISPHPSHTVLWPECSDIMHLFSTSPNFNTTAIATYILLYVVWKMIPHSANGQDAHPDILFTVNTCC